MKPFTLLPLLALVLPLLTPAPGHAEIFRSDRLRYSRMEVVFASGSYAVSRAAVVALNFGRESGQPESITLSSLGRKLTARIWKTRLSPCGDRYYARLAVPDENIATDLVLSDYSHVRCRIYVRDAWHMKVSTREPDGSLSEMELSGNPDERP